jgi:lipopolysaccharide/colanic/teichoic acid biosynthesis glycosyltransferase
MEQQETTTHRLTEGAAMGQPVWKRVLDLTLILLVCPGLVLVGGLVALLVKLGSPGPLFFRQRRVGYQGVEFVCYKFRTMRVDADTDSHRRHTQDLIRSQTPMVKLDARRDPGLVPFGSLVRVSGLDELPQIINVLRGEMSLVGPRPCIPYECEAYEPWHWGRFGAAPGLTGLWQVSGKNRTTFDQMVRLDIEYSKRMNLWLDLKIIVKTLPALWDQYCDQRTAQSQVARSTPTQMGEPVESYTL